VSLRHRDINRAAARGLVDPVIDGVWKSGDGRYDETRGLTLEGADHNFFCV
jgi:hypothetical protein